MLDVKARLISGANLSCGKSRPRDEQSFKNLVYLVIRNYSGIGRAISQTSSSVRKLLQERIF